MFCIIIKNDKKGKTSNVNVNNKLLIFTQFLTFYLLVVNKLIIWIRKGNTVNLSGDISVRKYFNTFWFSDIDTYLKKNYFRKNWWHINLKK